MCERVCECVYVHVPTFYLHCNHAELAEWYKLLHNARRKCTSSALCFKVSASEQFTSLSRARCIYVHCFLVVMVACRTLYVSEWGSKPGIFSLKTDGSGFTSLVNTSTAWPNGLAMDFPGKQLYWVDTKYKTVETIKLDGTDRTVVTKLSKESHPWSIGVFVEMMMWSDTDRRHIYFNNRFTGEEIKNISISQRSLNGIKIVQAALQTSGKISAKYLHIHITPAHA